MIGFNKQTLYKRGDNPELDKKFELFKKKNKFADDAYDDALSKKEAKTLIKVWSKARVVPWQL